MINTKKDIWVEGFYSQWEIDNIDFTKPNTIYSGKTSEIPEEVAESCVLNNLHLTNDGYGLFKDYSKNNEYSFETPEESIQSALIKKDGTVYPYCIISHDPHRAINPA